MQAGRTALGRLGAPDDVVEAVAYLIEADFVTGEQLVVDGGHDFSALRIGRIAKRLDSSQSGAATAT